MSPAWWFDPLSGLAFQMELDGSGLSVEASRLTLVQYLDRGGFFESRVVRHPGYGCGLEDPVPLRARSLVPCPARVVDACERAWSGIAVAAVAR